MKIIGGHDYYDKAMMHGVDTSVVLIRNNRELEDFSFYPKKMNLPYKTSEKILPVYVIVGDKLYSGLEYNRSETYTKAAREEYIWNVEAFDRLVEEEKINIKDPFHWNASKYVSKEEYFVVRSVIERVKELMLAERYSILHGFMINDRSNIKWIANPDNLRTIEFYKAIDPFTMYQTLDMWVSGVLSGSGNKTVEITDDKMKIHKHGFDVKKSFRKEKSGH